MKRKTKRHSRTTQGHALLYGQSSRAIRIVNGEIVGRAGDKNRSSKKNVGTVKTVRMVQKAQKTTKGIKAPKKYVMNESTQKKLDNLGDPLALMTRFERAQKYEAANSTEKYEYGLSDW